MAYQPSEKALCTMCGSPAIARKLCRKHYAQAHSKGKLEQHKKLGPEDVFASRYQVMSNGCWEWTGGRHEYGYGVFLLPGSSKHVRAHRYSFEKSNGPIPDGMVVMHKCDNPPCVNPDHLQLGTRRDNNWDACAKGRRPVGESHWQKCGPKDSQGRITRKRKLRGRKS